MWDVNETFSSAALEALPTLNFRVNSTGGVVRVEKYGCGAEFRRVQGERYRMTIAPTLLLAGQFTRLWDAGYQKFLIIDDGRRFPALTSQLQQMRRFNEELRTALGIPAYYNESIGSVCQVSEYDRLEGEPDAGVVQAPGAKPERADDD